jgi:hypothetical protein
MRGSPIKEVYMTFFFRRKPVVIAPIVKKPEISIAQIAHMKARAETKREDADTTGGLRRTRQTFENNRLI